MSQDKILKKYTGIKWALLLLCGAILISLIKGNVWFSIVLGCGLAYLVFLKKKYHGLLTNG